MLRGGVLGDGTPVEVSLDPAAGLILEVAAVVPAASGDVEFCCEGLVILPAPAEPHAHLDKALSAEAPGCDNPDGDLGGAISVWHAHWASLSHHDLVARATRAVETMVLAGTTAIRSHVDVGPGLGLTALRALLEVKQDVARRGLCDLQLVALVTAPLAGPPGAANRRLLEEALEAGVDVVGGCPYRDDDPVAATVILLEAAQRFGVPVDAHTDETLDPTVMTLGDLARLVAERAPGVPVTASHCVSLGMAEPGRQAQVAAAVAGAGVAVITLPQTNLYLQARGIASRAPRGLTALRALLEAGVVVGAGADNVRDPFCAVGRLDATETAALLVMAGHLSPSEAWAACSTDARRVMGVPGGRIAPGEAAEILCIEGSSLAGAVASGSERRLTIHAGRVVARAEVTRTLY